MKVANIYENNYKNLTKHNSYYDTIIKNGKWYFVSFLVFALNGNDTDYSSFDFNTDNIKREEIISLIEEFAKYYCELFEENTQKINSNTFKKSDQYLPRRPTKASAEQIRVMAEKTATSLFSLQPHSSKWWCRGDILNRRLPWVALK